MNLSKTNLATLVVSSLALGGALGAAVAPEPAKERHTTMEGVRDAAGPLFEMARKTAPFDAAVVNKNATTILEKLKHAQTLFPAGSGGGESLAKPEVWSDAAGFEKAMKEGQAAAAGLQAVKDEAGFAPAIGALGKSCKSCHDKYRLPPQ